MPQAMTSIHSVFAALPINASINGADAITGISTVQDANNDGLIDGLADYHLFHEERAIPFTNKQGETYSNADINFWVAIAATNQGSGYQVLLDGASSTRTNTKAGTPTQKE
jgi:hypothetical protein